jgi:nitrogen fixation NifU-like protein
MENKKYMDRSPKETSFEDIGGITYSENLFDHCMSPRNYGIITDPNGYAKVTGVCGDTVEIFLRVENGKIEEAAFTTDGCIFTVAACSVATEMATGKNLHDCVKIDQETILNFLKCMPEDHMHCALLASMTLQKALEVFGV